MRTDRADRGGVTRRSCRTFPAWTSATASACITARTATAGKSGTRRIAVIGHGASGTGLALALKTWSDHVDALHERPRPAAPARIARSWPQHDIEVHEDRIARVEHERRPRAMTWCWPTAISVPCDAIFFATGQRPQCDCRKQLGCAFTQAGLGQDRSPRARRACPGLRRRRRVARRAVRHRRRRGRREGGGGDQQGAAGARRARRRREALDIMTHAAQERLVTGTSSSDDERPALAVDPERPQCRAHRDRRGGGDGDAALGAGGVHPDRAQHPDQLRARADRALADAHPACRASSAIRRSSSLADRRARLHGLLAVGRCGGDRRGAAGGRDKAAAGAAPRPRRARSRSAGAARGRGTAANSGRGRRAEPGAAGRAARADRGAGDRHARVPHRGDRRASSRSPGRRC